MADSLSSSAAREINNLRASDAIAFDRLSLHGFPQNVAKKIFSTMQMLTGWDGPLNICGGHSTNFAKLYRNAAFTWYSSLAYPRAAAANRIPAKSVNPSPDINGPGADVSTLVDLIGWHRQGVSQDCSLLLKKPAIRNARIASSPS
jgi:hypothetical protein